MQSSRDRNLSNRTFIHSELRREVVGPDPRGERVATVPSQMSNEDYRSKFAALTQGNGEEVLRESPSRRYGAGVLYPRESPAAAVEGSGDAASEEAAGMLAVADGDTDQAPKQDSGRQQKARERKYGLEGEDDSLVLANAFKPSALGLSFVVNLDASGADAGIEVRIANRWRTSREEWRDECCGWYREHKIKVTGEKQESERILWLRTPLEDAAGRPPGRLIQRDDLRTKSYDRIPIEVEGFVGRLAIRWTARRWPSGGEHQRIVTVTLVNESDDGHIGADRSSLFQCGLVILAAAGVLGDYPREQIKSDTPRDPMDEELRNRVLYSKRRVRAVGHGCGADWGMDVDRRDSLWTDVMPAWEVPPMAFDVRTSDGQQLKLPMRSFARLDDEGNLSDEAFGLLNSLLGAYRAWIGGLDPSTFPQDLNATAEGLKSRCESALSRMEEGVRLLKDRRQSNVVKAFTLANKAMLMAQHRRPELRKIEKRRGEAGFTWAPKHARLDLEADDIKGRESSAERPIGHWRPFQLAFLLMSLAGTVHPDDEDRKTVDLIWFPTGGGKTEAYLGLTAFTVFHGLLIGDIEKRKAADRSVSVLMRYTLRLLTSQQFERAVRLFCAMELIRSEDPTGLGNLPLTVGLWVGSGSTPNQVGNGAESASAALRNMRTMRDAENPFVLLQCPWCGAPFGPVAEGEVHGYDIAGPVSDATFRFMCKDPDCEFGPGHGRVLPAQVVDECLYRQPPTLLIGTVDKFAMLAWKPEIRCFFGIGSDGKRVSNGPALVIQDEMHLITGPLGTMVGLYETVLEALCTHAKGSLPKIIASTATAARAEVQVRGLFARKFLAVFPPPGLDASDSFFAREDDASPGRLYVGVMAPGHGSMQTTQRRVYAALMQAAADIAIEANAQKLDPADEADPWWTLLAYYNSLRELGGALTLFGADIPDQLKVLVKRRGLSNQFGRKVYLDGRVMELTSRLKSGEVPEALRSLEQPVKAFKRKEDVGFTCGAEYGPMDACLASNIIEVGVDVPRLSLMAIVGQPKTTSSYIQASSRVGRREDRPGLVVMQYSPTKPRDRSHYERFRAYHQALYAWVEPTSVTPFSPPVVDRALHAVLVALLRQTLERDLNAQEVRDRVEANGMGQLEALLQDRAETVARPDEIAYSLRQMRQRLAEWRAYNPERFGSAYRPREDNADLLYPAGSAKPASWRKAGWATPTSLRAVDSSCEADVSDYYAEQAANDQGAG